MQEGYGSSAGIIRLLEQAPQRKPGVFRTAGTSWPYTNLLHHLFTAGPRHQGCTQYIHHVLCVHLKGGQGQPVGFEDAISVLQAHV